MDKKTNKKVINFDEVMKAAGISKNARQSNVFHHTITKNGETIEVITKSKEVSLFFSSMQGNGSFEIAEQIKHFASQLGNNFILQKFKTQYLVSLVESSNSSTLHIS